MMSHTEAALAFFTGQTVRVGNRIGQIITMKQNLVRVRFQDTLTSWENIRSLRP